MQTCATPSVQSSWMTERAGGSDVQSSETIAVYSRLPSNEMESGQISLFVAPTVKTISGTDGKEEEVMNGIRTHRLKNKMGMKELPTAELELKAVRAHMIGPKDRGFPPSRTLECDSASRMDAVGVLYHLPVKLYDHGFPSHTASHYSMLAASSELTTIVLRALTSASKAVIYEPDEPDFNVSRLCETVLHLTRAQNVQFFGKWVLDCVNKVQENTYRQVLMDAWKALAGKLNPSERLHRQADILADGRQIMFTLAWLVSGILLALDARRDGDEVAKEVARRWITEGERMPG
ncbi:uncharacterized protein ATNIH1004_009357 [Aspergillus tanneri]|uniref:Uncharacterized protein n=1 Tax=Aspergillus tanneri TaxID=1220188 RepID=A0A5M9MIH2_9EURO|nr:uncharacterized protein ATNIH1004_009357 [Aspergillus tanneri]KAA8645140.1 hypothetical protein ATNIH1004_009357 [Aspergillus tanneri]